VRWERKFGGEACGTCGACCREGFDLAPVRRGEAIARLHPDLVQRGAGGWVGVPRPAGRCLALVGAGTTEAPYRCRVYRDRPRACTDLEVAGDACLAARRRAGLSA
jgi:Fe-S-cluster containining protein